MDLSIKQTVKDTLLRKDYVDLIRLCQSDRRFWSALRSCLYETNEDLRRPAIEVTAGLMKKWWQEGYREKVREYIRSLLWLLNEESGGIGWSVPEVIAEIITAIPELLEPYGIIMITNALESQVLVNGSLWAIGRLGKRVNKWIYVYQEKVFTAFNNHNPETLGHISWAMGEVGITSAIEYLTKLKDREEPVRIYIDGRFQEKSLGEWASQAIVKINSSVT